MRRAANARSRRRGERAQAVLETALVIPIMLAMIAAFLGLMIQVQLQQEMDTATKLALASSFQAPKCARPLTGPEPCTNPEAVTAGAYCPPDLSGPACPPFGRLPRAKAYANDSFWGTMSFYANFLDWPDPKNHVICFGPWMGDGDVNQGTAVIRPSSLPAYDPMHPQQVYCHATAILQFKRTPLAWAVFWNPTIDADAQGPPPPFRQ